MMSNATKSFYILIISLSYILMAQQNYFQIYICIYVTKFSDFFFCVRFLCNNELNACHKSNCRDKKT